MSSLRNRHMLLIDVAGLLLTPLIALILRIDSPSLIALYIPALVSYTAFSLVVRVPVFRALGLYNRCWRFATVDELVQTVTAVTISSVLMTGTFLIGGALPFWVNPLPRSVPFIEAILVLCVVGSSRFGVRLAHRAIDDESRRDLRRVLIVGAGLPGQAIVRELQATPHLDMRPVGFLDDDLYREGLRVAGLPMLGKTADLPSVVRDHMIDQVVIALPDAPGKQIRRCLSLCEEVSVPAKTIPGMADILGNKITVGQIRNVEIEDLLRREPIQTDIQMVRSMIRGKRVLVTGAGGSIGSELCRQILRCAPSEIGLLGHGENSVFEIHSELSNQRRKASKGGVSSEAGRTIITPLIADIRSRRRIDHILATFCPDIIVHAAAHKHVPLMEANPAEAITNNVLGTKNLLDASLAYGVERFVMISTDKAVNPTSVMGATKRAAELLVMRAARLSGQPYVAVRFGNVLGSRGSVVPTFRHQIAAGGPVTVSHPEMTRYFMTIPEAVQLTLQAAILGKGGEVFMLDMGESVKIVDLARDLIELSGLEVGRDIDIVFTGVRPGEKLFEELLVEGETYQPTPHDKIRVAVRASAAIPTDLDASLTVMEEAVLVGDRDGIIRCLLRLIPEFSPDELRRSEHREGKGVAPGPPETTHEPLRSDEGKMEAARRSGLQIGARGHVLNTSLPG